MGHEDVCGGVLGRVGAWGWVLEHEDVCGGMLRCFGACWDMRMCVEVWGHVLECVEACWCVLRHEDTCYPMPEPLARPQLHTCHHVRTRSVLKRVKACWVQPCGAVPPAWPHGPPPTLACPRMLRRVGVLAPAVPPLCPCVSA